MTIFDFYINYVDVLFAIIVLIMMIHGAKKGMMITVANFIRYVFGFATCIFVSNHFSLFVYENYVRNYLIKLVSSKIVDTKNVSDTLNNFSNTISSVPKNIQQMFGIGNITLPKSGDISVYIVDEILQPIGLEITKALLFLCTFIVFFFITGIILRIVRKKHFKNSKKSVIKKSVRFFDGLFGGIFGVIKGFLLVFLIVTIISSIISSATNPPTGFFEDLNKSCTYQLLKDYNPFNLITEGIIWANLKKM